VCSTLIFNRIVPISAMLEVCISRAAYKRERGAKAILALVIASCQRYYAHGRSGGHLVRL
jgi:hypothetical protein